MRSLDTLPGESNTSIISSIINLVCPQCGGRMSEFQCEGRCCRNWLAEWEWANRAARSSKSRRGHAGRSMRRATYFAMLARNLNQPPRKRGRVPGRYLTGWGSI